MVALVRLDHVHRDDEGRLLKSSEEILEAFNLTGNLRNAAELAGCDHKTVGHYVALRDAGKGPDDRPQRPMLIDDYVDKV